MKYVGKLINRIRGLTNAILRFPLTAALLLAIAIFNGIDINYQTDKYQKVIIALIVGAALGIVAQVIYERYFNKKIYMRLIFAGLSAILAGGYYLIIRPVSLFSEEISIRTAVTLFALLIAFMWIPVIKNSITFNESFMITFKSFFVSMFFSGVLFLGTSIILGAVNELLFTVNYRAHSHAANIIFALFAPMYFLSLIPIYPNNKNKKDEEELDKQTELVNKHASCPKFLEILISYIIIPLVTVFTLILVLYICKNIGAGFWSNNLLEPMIIAYSIAIIIVYILASNLGNKFAVFFRKVFPKVLVPLVLLQTISSIFRIDEIGLTHGRYYVLLYGIFAIVAGNLFSFIPVRKNGIIAGILIIFSAISIIPPIDAFTVSRVSHLNMLEDVLNKNNMLQDNQVVANTSITDEDKRKIAKYMVYLDRMKYTDSISWIPSGFEYYEDSTKVFGFNLSEYLYNDYDKSTYHYVYLNLDENTPVDVGGYDYFVPTNVSITNNDVSEAIGNVININVSGNTFALKKEMTNDRCDIILENTEGKEIIRFAMTDVFDKYAEYDSVKDTMSLEEATFLKENDLATIKVVVRNVSLEYSSGKPYFNAEVYILINIK